MLLTTLCYIEHKGHYLMLHRTGKQNDINEGKWIGVGGKFIHGESPEDCLIREVFEETGYILTSWKYRGFITFLQEDHETEYMCLYTADDFVSGSSCDPAKMGLASSDYTAGMDLSLSKCPAAKDAAFLSDDPADWPVPHCDEGDLAWIPKDRVHELNLWPGDRIFLKLLDEGRDFFSLKLVYKGNDLQSATLDGKAMK